MNIKESIDKLELIATNLESDEIDLDKAIDEYATAIKLAKKVTVELTRVEKKITVLSCEADKIIEELVAK